MIRQHALGNFGDMVRASMRSPAMLIYLDQVWSTKWGVNENYARELMELHTLGVERGLHAAGRARTRPRPHRLDDRQQPQLPVSRRLSRLRRQDGHGGRLPGASAGWGDGGDGRGDDVRRVPHQPSGHRAPHRHQAAALVYSSRPDQYADQRRRQAAYTATGGDIRRCCASRAHAQQPRQRPSQAEATLPLLRLRRCAPPA
ncbi:MAG: DUF1800 family protein [Gemmatimonadetes bacterium]|nr:DUF1800 family protein [Gemmatimonadota bacterium]